MRKSRRIAIVTGSTDTSRIDGIVDHVQCLLRNMPQCISADIEYRTAANVLDFKSDSYLRKYDVIHFHTPNQGFGRSLRPMLLPLNRLLRARGARFVVTHHEWSARHLYKRLILVPLTLAASDIVFVTEQEMRAFKRTMLGRLCRARKHVIPIGLPMEIRRFDEAEIRAVREAELSKAPGAERLFVYFGFIYEQKQPELMIRSFAAAVQRGLKARFVILGDFAPGVPELEARIRELAADQTIRDRVEFRGFQTDPDGVAKTIAASDATVCLFFDGLTMRRSSFWTAAQCGSAVITTEVPADEVFTPGQDSFEPGHVVFVLPGATPDVVASALMDLPEWTPYRYAPIVPISWQEVVDRNLQVYDIAP